MASLKLQASSLGCSQSAPVIKFPPHVRVATLSKFSSAEMLPQEQLKVSVEPRSVSCHSKVILSPPGSLDGNPVESAGQPSGITQYHVTPHDAALRHIPNLIGGVVRVTPTLRAVLLSLVERLSVSSALPPLSARSVMRMSVDVLATNSLVLVVTDKMEELLSI